MNNSFYVRELLNEEDLEKIREQLETIRFEDGLYTLTGDPFGDLENSYKMKKCLNDDGGIENSKISDRLFGALDRDDKFLRFTVAVNTNKPIISRTEEGGYYRAHHDDGNMGDYSTTVFLNDPSEYEGGELRLKLSSEVKSFKLPAGHAVTYHTGIPHEVADVTSGHRDVAVFWTTALFSDDSVRDIYRDVIALRDILDKVAPGLPGYPSVEEASEHPSFVIEQIVHKMIRRFRKSG